QAWARREGLEVEPSTDPVGSGGPSFGTPRDGDEFLLEAGIPLQSQTIPVHVLAAPVRGLRVRVDGAPAAFDPARDSRLVLGPGPDPTGRGARGPPQARAPRRGRGAGGRAPGHARGGPRPRPGVQTRAERSDPRPCRLLVLVRGPPGDSHRPDALLAHLDRE